MATILITGIAGGLAQRVARQLLDDDHAVIGVDYRPLPDHMGEGLERLEVRRAHYNKTIIEEIFRHRPIDTVLHLGRSSSFKESAGKRFDLNVVGSQKIMNLCVQHGVKRLVVLSTFHIYGADPANHIPIAEDEPLRAGLEFPQIADAIQMDNMASTWVYRYPDVQTMVLRATNIVGPTVRNTMSAFLRRPRVPYLPGFNPMSQFVHEDDMTAAIIAAWQSRRSGSFNVAGPGVIPWRTALELCRSKTFPILWPLTHLYAEIAGSLPHYLVNFFRYPCVITDRAFRDATGWSPRLSMEDTLWSTVADARMRQ
jgi:UDP-glucose 4-epimerase